MEVLFLVLLLLAHVLDCYGTHACYITPNDDGQCPGNPCYTVDHYLQYPAIYFKSNTTFYFLQGIHTIDRPILAKTLKMSHLALVGQPPYSNNLTSNKSLGNMQPIIKCATRFAFSFYFARSILIANLTLISCGAEDSFIGYTAAVMFVLSTDVNIIGVSIQNSTGFGVFMLNVLGNSQIAYSRFIANRGDDKYVGGNLFLSFYSTGDDCKHPVHFTIQSSEFRGGNNLFPASRVSPGCNVEIEELCVDIFIQINDVIMSENGRMHDDPSYEGGNLGILVNEPKNTTGARCHISITNSHFGNGYAERGGGIFFFASVKYPCENEAHSTFNTLRILNTSITGNTASAASGGISITLKSVCQLYRIKLGNVTFRNNRVTGTSSRYVGEVNYGSMGLVVVSKTFKSHSIVVENCIFHSGVAEKAGGLGIVFLHTSAYSGYTHRKCNTHPQVIIVNSHFINNVGLWYTGLDIHFARDSILPCTGSPSIEDTIRIQDCTFLDNSGYHSMAIMIVDAAHLGISPSHFKVENVSFYNSRLPSADMHWHNIGSVYQNTAAAAVLLYGIQNVTFVSCTFRNNRVTALLAYESNMYFHGTMTFLDNRGWNGGALALFGSFLIPKPNTKMYFHNNHAEKRGGAFYVENYMVFSILHPCFLQPTLLNDKPFTETGIAAYFSNNTAGVAGSVLYGGYIDQCYLLPYSVITTALQNSRMILKELFFNHTTQNDLSVIASDPIGVCFCANGKLDCERKVVVKEVLPGGTFEATVVVVGQSNGIVPGVVHARFINNTELHSLDHLEYSQNVNQSCTTLNYSVFSNQDYEWLELTAESPDPQRVPFAFPLINIHLLPCPPGFSLSGIPGRCSCASALAKHGYQCDIHTQSIQRPSQVWVGCNYHFTANYPNNTCGVMVHTHCPLDYCKQQDTVLNLEHPDAQCALNHSGILCGKCRPGLSLAFGTSRCLKCSNAYLALLLAFVAAGLVLVALLLWCNLSVSEGTLNALILYANIIQASRPTFLPGDKINVLTVFVAWLNLDLGIETCFFNSMDMYAKAWLQFAFPAYIWILVALMIVLSHYYTTVARLVGQNAPKVLATLFLLSYAKLLRAVLIILSFTYLTYPDGHWKAVWLYDGDVDYFKGKHIPLFIAALLISITFLLPYTFVVFSMQWLRRKSRHRMLVWVRRLKPVFDPYGGPYKDKCQFWTGLLLVVRGILFLGFATNSSGNKALDLIIIIIAVMVLLSAQIAFFSGVYKSRTLDSLDVSFTLNLGILSTTTLYLRLISGNAAIPVFVSIAIAFTTFILIMLYHIYKYTGIHTICHNVLAFLTKIRRCRDEHGIHIHTTESDENGNHDVEFVELEQRPIKPPARQVRTQRLTYDEDGELMLVTDN